MPINYQEIYTQIKQVGQGAKERRKKKEEAQELAQKLLETYSSELDALRTKVDLPGRQTPIFAARFLWMKPSPLTTPHLILFQRL